MNDELQCLKQLGLYRELKVVKKQSPYISFSGKEYLDFSSNDYLSLSSLNNLQREFLEYLDFNKFVMSSGSSRLISGNLDCFDEYEELVGNAYKKSCLFFNCGYHANTGILPSLAGKEDLIIVDKLSHASLIDSLKLSEAKWLRFSHNDYLHLRKILSDERKKYRKIFVVTESVFSMDGDVSDLSELVKIKNEFDCLLYIDEAHSVGVFGKNGLGICSEKNLVEEIDFIMCTLGKAMGGEGAYLISSEENKRLLINKCRPLIFTTAIAPINVYWDLFLFKKFLKGDFESRKFNLKRIVKIFRNGMSSKNVLGDTHIVPIFVGESERALEISKALLNDGIYAPAIRYPTVPKNASRIRFSLSASMLEDEICACMQKILALI